MGGLRPMISQLLRELDLKTMELLQAQPKGDSNLTEEFVQTQLSRRNLEALLHEILELEQVNRKPILSQLVESAENSAGYNSACWGLADNLGNFICGSEQDFLIILLRELREGDAQSLFLEHLFKWRIKYLQDTVQFGTDSAKSLFRMGAFVWLYHNTPK
jgi:hypothetical protein